MLFLVSHAIWFAAIDFFVSGHNSSHMQIAAIEKVFNKSKDALKVRESEWIKEFGTLVPRGMNIKS